MSWELSKAFKWFCSLFFVFCFFFPKALNFSGYSHKNKNRISPFLHYQKVEIPCLSLILRDDGINIWLVNTDVRRWKESWEEALSVSSHKHGSLNSISQIHIKNASTMAHTFNISTKETEANRSLRPQASLPNLLDKLQVKERHCR